MRIRILLILFILSVLSTSNYAQTYPFRSYSIQDGLSESAVNDIIQDRQGYIWFATGYGLNKFDGIRFENFFEESGLNHTKIYALHQARDGKIWIGTGLGVNFLAKDSIYTPEGFSGIRNSEVISIFEDMEGHLWFGTNGDGVWHYISENEQVLFSTSQGLRNNQIRAIAESDNGGLWFATRDGLTRLSNGNLRTFTTEDGLPENRIRDLKIDKNGVLWIATRNGISRFNGEEFKNFGAAEGLIDPRVRTLEIAKNGTIWLGTEGGIGEFKQGVFTNYTSNEGLSNDIVYSSIIDREENLWVGTFGGGASLFLGNYIKNFDSETGLSNDLVTSITEDKAGNILIGTYGGGLTIKNGNSFEYFNEEHGLPDDRVYHLSFDSRSRLWIGMRNGLAYLENGRLNTFDSEEFPFRKIRQVMETVDGTLWVSTYDEGIIKFENDSFEQVSLSQGLASNTTLGSIEDSEGNIWVATYSGVSKITPDSIQTFTIQDGLPNNGVMSIIKDHSGTIWVSTFGGVAWFDGIRFIDITDEDGLPDRVCYFITQDSNQIFWIGTNAGIVRLDIQKFYSENEREKEQAIHVIDQEQGLISDEMNLGAVHQDKDGNFWFGSVEGVSYFNPAVYKGNLVPPKIHILGLTASGSTFKKSGVKLQNNRNFVQIDFSGLNFTSPNGVIYRYLLSGIDPDWQFTTDQNAKYPSLPHGKYKFQVYARNSNGIWSKDMATFNFEVAPPFWITWWFLTIVALGIAGIIYLFNRNYQYMQMVDIERIRVRIASDLHDDVGASLTEIALQSDFLQTSHADTKFQKSLNQIGKQCRKVVTSLDDIVWSIDARNDTLGDLTDRMQDYILNTLEPKEFKVSYDFEKLKMENKLPVPVKENLYLIFKEAVNNIAKYSNGNEVEVSMKSKNGEYEFKIHDNGTTGKGLKKTGHGLRNMEMRAQRIGGNFSFEDINGFTVILKGKLNFN